MKDVQGMIRSHEAIDQICFPTTGQSAMKETTLEETSEIFIRTCCERTRGNGFTMRDKCLSSKGEGVFITRKMLFLLEYKNLILTLNIR